MVPSHEALSVSPQGALEIPSVTGQPPSLDRNHFSTPRVVAESHKHDERCRPSSQRPQYPTLYRRLKRRLGCSLRAPLYKGSVVRKGKKATHKCSRTESGFSIHSKFQGPVPKPVLVATDNSTVVARHTLGHLNVKADLLSRSNQVQSTEWSLHLQVFKQICQKWFTPHVDLFATRLNYKVPLYVFPVPNQSAWDIDALNINLSGLTAYAYPPMALLHMVIQKVRQSSCLINVIAPGWPGMPWIWDLVQLSTEIPLQLPVSRTLLKQSHNYVFHSNPQHLNLHTWCIGVDSSKNKASLWR